MADKKKRKIVTLEVDDDCDVQFAELPGFVTVRECYPAPEDEWGEVRKHTRNAWEDDVATGNTNLGYWAWVSHQQEL